MIVRKTNSVVRGAFTLMEMLVVVAILVVLAGIGGYYYMGSLDKAKENAAKLQIDVLTKACQAYEVENGERPASLVALTQPYGNNAPKLDDPSKLMDPWNKQYQYNAQGSNNQGMKPDIWTVSPKGAQIGNWPGAHPR
jgi:general secretion pathway protein G